MSGDHDRDGRASIDDSARARRRTTRATRPPIWRPVIQVIRMLVIPAPDLDDRTTPPPGEDALISGGQWRPVLDPPEADAADPTANR
nr:hypothetical protein [Micromonospora sp. DSM 115978]